MAYLDGIWHVGQPRAEGVHADFLVWHMLINLHNVCKNLSEAFLRNGMPYLDDIWYRYVGRARAKYFDQGHVALNHQFV